ncbi:type IV pilus modification PilV family protein [Vibrio gallaecicus]|uniref:Prepilin-type N-terminal cleavage/methylation domain-containing protein n=1 Tax=Vibrio gallaecicus TaxID=552386 RepID=A0ABV4NDY4_9VIBR
MICKQKGFSLIEVLISFLLIGVGALSLVKLQVFVEQKADYAIHSVEALNIAERQMEYYRTRADDVSGATNLIAFSAMASPDHCLTDMTLGTIYTLTCDASALSLSNSLRHINVQVSWQDRLSVNQSVFLETMISKYSEFD